MPEDQRHWGPNPGYVLGQLAKALTTEQEHEDPATRDRARKKAAEWREVLEGVLSGVLNIGSRTPVKGTPAWVTLRVLHGGFATGGFAAGGRLKAHEKKWLRRFGKQPKASDRARLNGYFLSDDGIRDLQQILETGCYRVQVPEEGALLVIAWLLRDGQTARARAVLDEISPFLARLRFYPVPHPRPLAATAAVHVQTVGQTIEQLEELENRDEVETMREALRVWNPLYDRTVQLFAETVEGEIPSLGTSADGMPLRSDQGKFEIRGGWPCQRYPEGWRRRARRLLDDYRRQRARHRRCGKPERPVENFPRLRAYLQQILRDPSRLSGADVGMIRLILASIETKRGLPGSPRCEAVRKTQKEDAARPTAAELARVMAARLGDLAHDDGLGDLEAAAAPVTPDEARRFGLAAGTPFPERLTRKLLRCLSAPVDVLVDRGIIVSGEVLAQVIPQMTSQISAAAIEDPCLRRLYGAIYTAFRRRRSLLLLNLKSQVKIDELPWVAAVQSYRGGAAEARELARRTLEQVVVLTVTAFPHMILPNKLLQEIRALSRQGRLDLPIVDELAADIFMNAFSNKFLAAAKLAAERLRGTLYEVYYEIPYGAIQRIQDVRRSGHGTATSERFYEMCCQMAGEPLSGRGWSAARNGKIIEQSQILTTHNLATLFGALGLEETLGPQLPDLVRRCFAWVCCQLQLPTDDWRRRLKTLKNTAYAWRQMIFYLSLVPEAQVEELLLWANEQLEEQPAAFRTAFRPALVGLERAARGEPAGPEEAERRFLGWTTGKHWLR